MMRNARGSVSVVVLVPQDLDERITALEQDTGHDRSTVVRMLLNEALGTPKKQAIITESLNVVQVRVRKAMSLSTRDILDAITRNLSAPEASERVAVEGVED